MPKKEKSVEETHEWWETISFKSRISLPREAPYFLETTVTDYCNSGNRFSGHIILSGPNMLHGPITKVLGFDASDLNKAKRIVREEHNRYYNLLKSGYIQVTDKERSIRKKFKDFS